MKAFVLDASVTLAWLIDTTLDPYARRVRRLLESGARAIVPTLWQWEIANGFVMAERRGTLTPSDTAAVLQSFELTFGELIEIRPALATLQPVIAAARKSRLTAYDAAYLSLAREERLPLATLDRRLADAAKLEGLLLVS